MRRLAIIVACAACLLVAAPASGSTTADDTAAVCDRSGQTVSEGLKAFLAELDRAGTAAGKGDAGMADQTVKHSGAMLADLAGKLRKETERAQNAELRAAAEEFAKELEALGARLTGVTALNTFDTTRLQLLAERVAVICGE